jgi:hypothetical protein
MHMFWSGSEPPEHEITGCPPLKFSYSRAMLMPLDRGVSLRPLHAHSGPSPGE